MTTALVVPLLIAALVVSAAVLCCYLSRKKITLVGVLTGGENSRFANACLCCCSKKVSKRQDQDVNPTYGDYEYEDGSLRKNTMEVIDQNEDYGQAVVRID